MKTNPLNPQYLRYSDSRRHVQIYGDIEGSKPKKYIIPNTRRQTNMIEDIQGAHSKNAIIRDRKEINFSDLRPEIKMRTAINPITGEEYKIKADSSFNLEYKEDKNNMDNKSRRLVRILQKFNNFENSRDKSRSSIRKEISLNPQIFNSIKIEEPEIIQRIESNRRRIVGDEGREKATNSAIYSPKEAKDTNLPNLSQRKRERPNESFQAYEDETANLKLGNRRSRMKDRNQNVHLNILHFKTNKFYLIYQVYIWEHNLN